MPATTLPSPLQRTARRLRRSLLAAALTAGLVVALAPPADAAELGFARPAESAVISTAQELVVRSSRTLGEEVAGVEVLLTTDGSTPVPGATPKPLECLEEDGCGSPGQFDERWGGVMLRPDGAPFATGPVCNGGYRVVARGSGQQDWATGRTVVLSDRRLPAVADLVVDGEPRAAELDWTPLPHADVRYLVERRAPDASSWVEASPVLPPGAGSYDDIGVREGTWEYRLVALRGDGVVDGRAAEPCADADRDVVAASAARTVRVAPGPTPAGGSSPTPTPTATTGSGTDGGEGPPDATAADSGDGSPAPAGEDDGDPDGQDGTAAASGTGTTRVPAPPAPARRGPDTSAPVLPGSSANTSAESYFGEAEEFSEELGYDAADAIVAEQDDDAAVRFIRRATPQALQSLGFDPRRILSSVAGGLVLITLALHLRRWQGALDD